jgi:hypothetical protein
MIGSDRARLRAACAALVVTLLSSGCLMLDELRFGDTKRAMVVRELAETYGDYLRWGRLEQAAAFVHPDQRMTFLAEHHRATQRLRFTEYEVQGVEIASSNLATVMVTMRIYQLPAIEERFLTDIQQWKHDQGRWYLSFEFPRYLETAAR